MLSGLQYGIPTCAVSMMRSYIGNASMAYEAMEGSAGTADICEAH